MYLEGLVRVRISVGHEIGHLQILSQKILQRDRKRYSVRSLDFGGSWFVGWGEKNVKEWVLCG